MNISDKTLYILLIIAGITAFIGGIFWIITMTKPIELACAKGKKVVGLKVAHHDPRYADVEYMLEDGTVYVSEDTQYTIGSCTRYESR